MSSVLSGSSMILNNVYIKSIGTTCGIDEFNGPLGDYFDRHYPDFHFGYDSYEQAEIAMLQDAIAIALKKVKLKKGDIEVYFGGDLNNQVFVVLLWQCMELVQQWDWSLIMHQC